MKTKKLNPTTMATIAVMTAVMCIFGPMSVPIGPVPISLTVFTVFLSVCILGAWKGTLAYIVYLLIGLTGIPVLSNYTGGPEKLFGPTGGYLIGFIPMALISGFFIDRFRKIIGLQVTGMLLGLAVCYAFGTAWLAVMAGMTFSAALKAGVLPFVPFDLIKIAVSVVIGRAVRTRLTPVLHLQQKNA
uniref:biotin transporter BioY n=1 Tax=Eubacterium cellulosolvens TaxID=29322 RepID=UPI0004800DBE|nr:biotin transporter BioY [[Eubacterium] cellulosolvens]